MTPVSDFVAFEQMDFHWQEIFSVDLTETETLKLLGGRILLVY